MYVSKHGLKGKDLKNLNEIVKFIVNNYYPIWFDIKVGDSVFRGPHHILKEIDIVNKMNFNTSTAKQVKSIAMKFISKGAWQCHSEILLLTLLFSNNVDERQFAIAKI